MDKRVLAEALALEVIKETIATMMDAQPITVIGQEHPAKSTWKKLVKRKLKWTKHIKRFYRT